MTTPTRWAGVAPADRRSGRRRMLVQAALDMFGDDGAAMSVRSLCRATGLHHRYFYENFADTNELLGAAYDEVYRTLRATLTEATLGPPDDRAKLRAGIRAVLEFSSADPRRGRILFTAAETHPVLVARRAAAQTELREYIMRVRRRGVEAVDPVAAEIDAAIYAGATVELNKQWLAGALGDDLGVVIERAVTVLIPRP